MKKYVILIWIYALSIIYMIAHVIPVIAFNADVYDDFFVRHYSLYYYSQPIISILFYALFEMSVICLSKKLKQNRNLEEEINAEAVEWYCLLVCSLWLARPGFFFFFF